MLDLLERHLSFGVGGCVVHRWLESRSTEEKAAFEKIKQNSNKINVVILYKDMNDSEALPFKLTAFRSHLRGYCTCPK